MKGSELKAERVAKGITQTVLAKQLGMTQSELSKLERRDDMLISTARRYLAALGKTFVLDATLKKRKWPASITIGWPVCDRWHVSSGSVTPTGFIPHFRTVHEPIVLDTGRDSGGPEL